MPPDLHVDIEIDPFVARAQPGDVVLLANTTITSHFIRFGTHRPFSHAGLMIDAHLMRSAYPGKKPKHRRDPKAPSVHDDDLRGLFAAEYQFDGWYKFDSALLLRPACTTEQIDAVIAASAELFHEAVNFHRLDILRIAVMLVCQEGIAKVDDDLPATPTSQNHHRLWVGMVQHLLRQVEVSAMPADDPTSLVCSEMVYRAFMNAGVDIPLPNPIVQLRRPGGQHLDPDQRRRLAGEPGPGDEGDDPANGSAAVPNLAVDLRRSGPDGRPGVVANSIVGLGIRTGNLPRLVGEHAGAAEAFGEASDDDHDLLERLRLPWDVIEEFILRLQRHRSVTNAIDAEFVTPSDFLGSPLFTVVAAYTRVAWPYH